MSQFGGVASLPIRKEYVLPIRGSQFREVLSLPIRKGHMLPIRRGPNSEGSCFCESGWFPVRRGPIFANPEASYFANPGVPIRRGRVFANPEGHFRPIRKGFQFGGVLFLPTRKGHILAIRGSQFGGVLFLPIRKGQFLPIGTCPNWMCPVFINPVGFQFGGS